VGKMVRYILAVGGVIAYVQPIQEWISV